MFGINGLQRQRFIVAAVDVFDARLCVANEIANHLRWYGARQTSAPRTQWIPSLILKLFAALAAADGADGGGGGGGAARFRLIVSTARDERDINFSTRFYFPAWRKVPRTWHLPSPNVCIICMGSGNVKRAVFFFHFFSPLPTG